MCITINDLIATKKIGPGTRFIIPQTIIPLPRTEVEPVVINDTLTVDRYIETSAKNGSHSDDRITLHGRHGILTGIKITQVFQTNTIGILSRNTGWRLLQRSSAQNCAIRESSKMLTDIRPSIVTDMVVFHTLLQLKMVGAFKVNIRRTKSMMLLNY